MFNSDFKIGKIEAGITYEKLSNYNVFVIGVPTNRKYLTTDEIDALIRYVKDGGSLLVINDQGGDYENRNNLSELMKNFGVTFNPDHLFDNENFSKDNSRPIITQFKSHFITHDLLKIIHSGGCTLTIDKTLEDADLNIIPLAFSSENNSWHKIYNGKEWVEEMVSNMPILAAGHYGLGKVIALTNLSILSGFHDQFGIQGADNFKLVANIIAWLLNKAHSEDSKITQPIFLTLPIEQDLYYWMRDMIQIDKRWNSIKELVNFALNIIKIRLKNQ